MGEEMSGRINEILEYNKRFVESREYTGFITSGYPDKRIVVLSCMDTRLTELLPKAMDLRNGDAKFVKNAGATVMHPFGSITRSIILAVYEFNAEDVMVVGHYGCGVANLNGDDILEKAVKRGIDQEILSTLKYSGIEIDKWLTGFESAEDAVVESVERLRNHPLMPKDVNIHGLLMHPETGKLDFIVSK